MSEGHGFQWMGQGLDACNGCGEPLECHSTVEVLSSGAGPFFLATDGPDWEYVSLAEAMRRMPMFASLVRGTRAQALEGTTDE